MKLIYVINYLRPDAKFIVKNDETILWLDEVQTEPTQQEIDDAKILLEEEQLIERYKTYYMKVIDNKLNELDYDSLATVQLWIADATFGAEATSILAWYKNIIAFNYAMINDIKAGGAIPTKEEYLLALPKYGA